MKLFDTEGLYDYVSTENDLFWYALKKDENCINKKSILEYAELEGWKVDDFGFNEKLLKTNSPVSHGVRIHIKPSIPFTKEPGAVFIFDNKNCLRTNTIKE